MGMNAARLSRSFDGVPRQIPSGREMAAILELKAVLQRFFDWGRNIFPSFGVIEPRLNARSLTAGTRPLLMRVAANWLTAMWHAKLALAKDSVARSTMVGEFPPVLQIGSGRMLV